MGDLYSNKREKNKKEKKKTTNKPRIKKKKGKEKKSIDPLLATMRKKRSERKFVWLSKT